MQVVPEYRPDRAVGQAADFERTQAGRLEGVAPMRPGEPDDAEAGTEALFGMRLRSQHQIHQGRGVGPDLLGLPADLCGRHAGVSPMAGRHVPGHGRVPAVSRGPNMGGDALAVVEDLDGPRRDPDPQRLLQQLVRNRVVVPLDLDVIVEPGVPFEPFGVFVWVGGQRFQRRLVELLEQFPAAGAEMPGDLGVQPAQQLLDRRVQFGQREEPTLAQPRDDPALDEQDTNFGLGLLSSPGMQFVPTLKRV